MAHALAQAPQFATSEVRSTQVPPHNVCPAGHSHVPAAQLVPPEHLMPHAPQFVLSPVVSTQAPAQDTRPVGQSEMQCPSEHDSWDPQACPQAPQLAELTESRTQAPPHATSPRGHTHRA
jgi:hypothetical protein